MIDHSQKAAELFKQGYNCSQSVFGAFAEELGLDLETSLKISSSFGGGMGRLREVCGAVSGMFMVAGAKYGYSDPKDKAAKTEHYKRIGLLAKAFKDENHSIICRELLGLTSNEYNPIPDERTKEYYKKRPCVELVAFAARLMDEMIEAIDATGSTKKLKQLMG